MKENNVCCRIYKEQLNLINQLPKKERAIVLLDVINHAFSQFENQNANQIDGQFDNAYISVSVSVSDSVYNSVSSISKAVIEILRKSVVCKGFSSNYGGNRKKKAEEKPKELPKTEPKTRFVKPTLQEISAYCQERNNGINAQQFVDFYESKGWKVGNSPMKDWQAAVRNWERRAQTGDKNDRGTDYNRSPELGKYAGFGRKISG